MKRGIVMEQDNNFYRCATCGNIVHSLHNGGGRLICCGSQMVPLEAREGGMASQNHLPVLKHEDGRLIVTIAEEAHPIGPFHHIEWIALVTPKRTTVRFLKEEDGNMAAFSDVRHGTVYSYCSIHQLWKKTF